MGLLPEVPIDAFPVDKCCRDTYISKYLQDDANEIYCAPQGTAKWHNYRKLRVTGSKIHTLFTASRNSKTNWEKKSKDYFWPKKFQSDATQYGIKTEKLARDKYKERYHEVTVLDDCGLIVSPQNPWLGFSPDGVIMKDGRPYKLLEIKCPLLGETKSIDEVLPTLSRYLKYNEATKTYSLKKRNEYYSQITLGMALLNVRFCDFVVFTKYDQYLWIETVELDETYAATLLVTVKQSFFNRMLHQICLSEEKPNEVEGITLPEDENNSGWVFSPGEDEREDGCFTEGDG